MLFGALAGGLISGKLGNFYQFGSLFRGLGFLRLVAGGVAAPRLCCFPNRPRAYAHG
jgi:hypothetical protein